MSRWLTCGLTLAIAAGVCLMVGCEDPFHSSSSGGSAGTVTVQGNVSDFSAPVAAGVKAGVTVMLKGTSYSTTTADDGTFVISGVKAGNYILVIKYGDAEYEYPLGDIAANSRVEITDITVNSSGSVIVAKIQIIDLGTNSTTTTVDDSSTPASTGTVSVKMSVVRGS